MSKTYHFIGIKGSGMSALALMLHQMGHKVQGSDVEKYHFTQRGLEQAGIPILPFDEKNMTEDVELIAGNAFREDNNVEVAYAIKNGYSFKRYHEFLGHFMDQFTSFGVAGAHGKTSTTGLLSHVMKNITDTSYLIGDGTGRGSANAQYFVFESDEYERHFMPYHPAYSIITNIDFDHPDYFTSIDDVFSAFDDYAKQVQKGLILDEAQVMKNTQTKIAQYLRDFSVPHCLALSGTPIENHLLEIWSIFQIILPGLLPAKKTFLKLTPKEVARYISPFILRRKKEEVLPDLPDLIEITHQSELSDAQKAIYLAQLQQMQQGLISASDQEINRRKVEILSGITRLRQICDTPALFMDYAGDSGKLDSLRELLSQIKESDHRVLIFSQFRGMLDITEGLLQELGISSYKLTGSTPSDSRQEMTRAFNQGSRDAFLISLKAGGVGLNLTGADTVILIDLWWNPAVEMQAISRAHRIGQEQNVEVYRLITRGTIEEKILELQEGKKNLVTTVLDGNESRASMTVEDIKEILGIAIS